MIAVESHRSACLCLKHSLIVILSAVSLAACGGGGGDVGGGGDNPPSSYAVGGSITGLSGTVVLQNSGGETLSISAIGAFRFNALLPTGASYQVSVASQPVSQRCVVTAGSGMVGLTDVGTVSVHCTNTTFTVGGTVSGLSGTLVLRNNDTDELTLTANGEFFFPTAWPSGSSYRATVLTQPANQQCTLSAASGSIASSNIRDIAVTCSTTRHVSGTVSGLTGTVVLQNNGADDLSVSANGSFTFATPLTAGVSYQVAVRAQPASRQCTVTSGSGMMGSTDITGVLVTCVPTFAVSGNISGLSGSVVLQNGSDQLTLDHDGAFTFSARLLSGVSYAVSFLSGSDPTQRCSVSSGTGTVSSADITDVKVTCIAKAARYKPESYASFTSLNGATNPEGTWVLLAEGTMSRGYLIAGTNPRQDYQLWSRATVRIRRDPANSMQYFVLTCGPGGARNDLTTRSASTFQVPFYSAGTTSWFRYGVTIEDATTMRRESVSHTHAFTGNSDALAMGWNLAWVLKRISDDPFSDMSTVRDNLLGQSKDASCIYESDGTYRATENDGTTRTTIAEGRFFWTDAYERQPSQLLDDANSYFSRFYLRDEIGFRTAYRADDNAFTYSSTDGALIRPLRSFSEKSSSHSVRAVSADGLKTADDTLVVPP